MYNQIIIILSLTLGQKFALANRLATIATTK